MVKLARQSGVNGMKIIIALLAVAIVAIAGLTILPTAAVADDCNGCGPHKSKFQ